MSDQTDQTDNYDIAIIGGGMVGISLALLLAQQKRWKIVVLESQPMEVAAVPEYSPSFDARSTALSWSSRKIFQSLGIWSQLQRCASAISTIHVSDRGHFGLTRIQAQEAGVEALGYVVENNWLGSVLLERATNTDMHIRGAVEVTAIKALASSMRLTIEAKQGAGQGTEIIHSKLLISADGAGSCSAQKLGIQQQTQSYGHSGIVANISLQKPHNGVAYERFTDRGPMALLPLSDFQNRPRSALVWTQPSELAEPLMAADDETFLAELQERFGHRLGQFMGVGDRVSYPLALTTSEEQVRRRLVVVGNAAHSLHPVAGQGFNLSLRDVAVLANCLADSPEGADIGALEPLQLYQQQQSADQRNRLIFSHNLPKLFGLSSPLVALGRNSGLLMMDLILPLRKQFARFGMGLDNSEVDYGSL